MNMKRATIAGIIALSAIGWPQAAAAADGKRIVLDFPDLAQRATETVDVTLDGPMLRLAGRFLSTSDSDERAVREMINGLEGIYVRSYEFDADGAYDPQLADKVRAQLGPTWKKIVKVTSKRSDNVDIYTDMRGEAVAGLIIISAEPREFTVVNIVGPIDLEKLASLEGQFGIPRISKKGVGEKGKGDRHE
jgi:hypothetical protein